MSEIRVEVVQWRDLPDTAQIRDWNGAGMVANQQGDLYGTAPHRIIRHGKITIDAIRVPGALAAGWRLLRKAWPDVAPGDIAGAEVCDPDFAWMERTEAERPPDDA